MHFATLVYHAYMDARDADSAQRSSSEKVMRGSTRMLSEDGTGTGERRLARLMSYIPPSVRLRRFRARKLRKICALHSNVMCDTNSAS